ncbi:MAG: bile acid:sodium symporter [Aeromicrobium erythreum]
MRARLDPFILALVATALLGSFLPAAGDAFEAFRVASVVAIGLLFFLYGTRLSFGETVAGLRHWRLHAVVLTSTFVLFPLAGLAVTLLPDAVLRPGLAQGVLLLTLVPSTVQSCVVYTRQARGNVAGAVVSASLSSLVGVVLTPVLVGLLMSARAEVTGEAVLRIVAQILAPFVLGQLARPLLASWVDRHDRPLKLVDRGSILLVVYVAFSEGAKYDVWSTVSVVDVLTVVGLCAVLLAAGYAWSAGLARAAGFDRPDRVAVLFCGSNKSLASGLPIATVLFSGGQVALLVLPLMFFHQLQIIAGAFLAERLARRADGGAPPVSADGR